MRPTPRIKGARDRCPSSMRNRRTVFLHQLGELRNRVAETMAYRASGLNLVLNAIVLWNTVYLSRAVDYIRSQGIVMPDELLSQVAPLPRANIALTGD